MHAYANEELAPGDELAKANQVARLEMMKSMVTMNSGTSSGGGQCWTVIAVII